MTDAAAFGVETIELDLPPLVGRAEPAPARCRRADDARALGRASRGRSRSSGRSPAGGSTGRRARCSCPTRRRCTAFDAVFFSIFGEPGHGEDFEPEEVRHASRRRPTTGPRRARDALPARRAGGAARVVVAARRRDETTSRRGRGAAGAGERRGAAAAQELRRARAARARAALPADVAPASWRRRCGGRAATSSGRHGERDRHAAHAARQPAHGRRPDPARAPAPARRAAAGS